MSNPNLPQRHHWLNTIVGQIDAAFLLTAEELFAAETIVADLLNRLNIPERGAPSSIPAPLAAELTSKFWAVQLHDVDRTRAEGRQPRTVDSNDVNVSLDVWRNALSGLILSAYPSLSAVERLVVTTVFDDLLLALGLPGRAPRFVPETVIQQHLDDN